MKLIGTEGFAFSSFKYTGVITTYEAKTNWNL